MARVFNKLSKIGGGPTISGSHDNRTSAYWSPGSHGVITPITCQIGMTLVLTGTETSHMT